MENFVNKIENSTKDKAKEKTFVVDIFDLSYEGAGVGRLFGKVIFVPKTLPTEKVRVKIEKEFSTYYIGKIVELLNESELRTVAPCPYFDICGGCDFQQCNYENELKFKCQTIKKQFDKIGCSQNFDVEESSKRFFYRNKIKLEVVENKLGYFRAKTHEFFEVKKCLIASEEINNSLEKINLFLQANNFLDLKNVYIKEVENRILICLLFDKKTLKNYEKIKKNIKNFQILGDFLLFFAFGDILESDKTKIFSINSVNKKGGSENQFLQDYKMQISAFSQVNGNVAESLYAHICQNTTNLRVVNAFSGQGQLTKMIAQQAKFVYGIEYQVSAHESAEKLLENFENVQNICGLVEQVLPDLLERDKLQLIVFDPPRGGCKKAVLDGIKASKIPKILYISCNFSTLIRDLQLLQSDYQILEIKLFDMFPCTKNMEVVVSLQLEKM